MANSHYFGQLNFHNSVSVQHCQYSNWISWSYNGQVTCQVTTGMPQARPSTLMCWLFCPTVNLESYQLYQDSYKMSEENYSFWCEIKKNTETSFIMAPKLAFEVSNRDALNQTNWNSGHCQFYFFDLAEIRMIKVNICWLNNIHVSNIQNKKFLPKKTKTQSK